MRFLSRLVFSLSFILLSAPIFNKVYAEGTKELSPTIASDNIGVLQIFDNNDILRNSMTYNAYDTDPVNQSKCMHIKISNPGEVIYFGVNYDALDVAGCNSLWYRIRAPSGAIVFGPQQVTNTGAGSIANYNQAVIGPNSIVGGAGGYTPLSYTPSGELGDYIIEFNRNNANVFINTTANCSGGRVKTRIRYFDVTVTDAPNGNKITGRLHSKTWDITANSALNALQTTMFVYTDEGIVSSVNFNGVQPFGIAISCNRTGVSNTGNATVDRRSVLGNVAYAEYPIFLNNPDITVYPTGVLGNITGAITLTGCLASSRCINVPVDKAGESNVLLNLNGVPGYQIGTADVLLSATLVPGNNCIPWDSKDGLGNLVAEGTSIEIEVEYYNGLMNLPLFDLENNPTGYIIDIVRPSAAAPQIYWDDTSVPGGTSNLVGCTSSLPTNGCHRWSGTLAPDGITVFPNWGNTRTINTWWYANRVVVSTGTNVPFDISVDANIFTPGTGSNNNDLTCANLAPYQLNGAVSVATGGTWTSSSGNVAGFTNVNVLTPKYVPSPADVAFGSVSLVLTSTGNGACPAVKDSILLTFQAAPLVFAGGTITDCETTSSIALTGASFTGAAGIIWSGGGGTFLPSATVLNTTYIPTPVERSAGIANLSLTTVGIGVCPAAVDMKTIVISPVPVVSAGADQNVCVSTTSVNISGTVTNASSLAWTTSGDGSFSPPTGSLTPVYILGISDASTVGNIILTATSTGNGACAAVNNTITLSVSSGATVNAGTGINACTGSIDNGGVQLNGNVSGPTTTGMWSSSTGGTFTPDNVTLNAKYIPSVSDTTNKSATITLSSTNNGSCATAVDLVVLTFVSSPIANAGADQAICKTAYSSLAGNVINASGGAWSTSGSGSFSPNATTLNANYIPSTADKTAGTVNLTLTTTGNGVCLSTTDAMTVVLNNCGTTALDPGLQFPTLSRTLTYGTPSVQLVASSNSKGNIRYALATLSPCVTITNAGLLSVTCTDTVQVIAFQDAIGNFAADTAYLDVYIIKAFPTIVLEKRGAVAGGQPFSLQLTTNYGGQLVYSMSGDPNVANITSTGVITPLNTGTITVQAFAPADDNFNAAYSVTVQIIVYPQELKPVAVRDIIVLKNTFDTIYDITQNDYGTTASIALSPKIIDLDPTVPGTQDYFYQSGLGTFSVDANGLLSVNAFTSFYGLDSIYYTITDANGRISNVASIVIKVRPPSFQEDLKANEIITPNNDNKNDVLYIGNTDLTQANDLIVVDAAGNIIYSKENYQNDWSATDSQGNKIGNDVYYFLFREVPNGEMVRQLKGYFTVVR